MSVGVIVLIVIILILIVLVLIIGFKLAAIKASLLRWIISIIARYVKKKNIDPNITLIADLLEKHLKK